MLTAARPHHRSPDSRNLPALGDLVPNPDRHQGRALRRGRRRPLHRRIRNAPRPHSRSRRPGSARRLYRRLRRHQQHPRRIPLRHSGDGHRGALLGDVVLRRNGGLPQLQRVLGDSTVQLIDTYDTLEGARHAAKLGGPFWGVRLDSGDFARRYPARSAPSSTKPAAATPRSWSSGDLDEYKIRELHPRRRTDRRFWRRHATRHFRRRANSQRHLQNGRARNLRHQALHRQIQRR